MPTLNNDSSAVAVNPVDEASTMRCRRIVGISLGATLLTVIVLFAAMAFAPGDASAANTCTLTSTAPTTNWTDTTKWSGCGGTYPGAGAGDTASVGLSGFNLNVNTTIANGVIVNLTGSGVNLNIPSGSTLQLEVSSTSTSSNAININGGQLSVGAGTINWGGSLVHNTGTLALTGTLSDVSGQGTFTINGGFINGPGTLKNVSGSAMSITGSGGGINVDGATIDNFGSITYGVASPNTLSLLNGGKIKLESGSSMSITSNGSIQTNNVGSPAIDILSGGALSKGTSASTTQIDAIVNNAGSVTVTSGNLNLYGGGTHTGAFSTGTGGTIIGFNGAHTLSAGTTAAGSGVYELVGGTFDVNTTAGSPWAPSSFNQSGGTLGGTGTMRVTSTFNWTGGTQSSAGTTDLTGTTNVNGSSVTLDSGRIMTNSGTFNYVPSGAAFLTINGSAHIDNTGTINLQNDATIASSLPSTSYILTSGSGFFKKTAGTSSSVNCGFRLNGAGTLQPAAGTTISLNGGTGTGTFGGSPAVIDLTGASSKVDLAGGSYTFSGSTLTVSGSGTLRLSGSAVLQLTSGPLSVNNFVQDGSSLLQASATGISVPTTGVYTWNGGTIDGASASVDVITVNGSGGQLKITGSSGAMTMQNSAHIKNFGGTIDFNPVANLAINSGSVLDNNSGSFVFNNNNSFGITTDNFNNPLFTNNGAVTKAANANTVPVSVKFNHNTTLFVNGGTLQLLGGGTSAGSMTITNAADRIEIAAGQYFMTTGATVGGNGTFAVTNGATLTNNTTLNVNNFELNSGTVNGGGGLTINAGFKWLGGTFTGSGSATISPGVITDATAPTSTLRFADGFTFINNGTFNYNPTFNLSFENNGGGGVSFTNNGSGIFDIKGNGTTAITGSGNTFSNFGTIKKTAGSGGFTFTIRMGNQSAGIIDEQFGSSSTIAFNGSGSFMSGGQIKATNAAGDIDFTGGDFTVSGGSFAGPGTINVKGGTLTINAAQTFSTLFTMNAGQINGTQTIDIASGAALNWSGGTITGSAGLPITILSGGSMNADTSSSSLIYDTRPLVINSGGTFTWNNGANSLIFQSGAAVSDSGAFTVGTANGTLGNNAAGSFSVTGTFAHNNAGTLNVTLPLNVQSGGTMTSSGGGVINLLNSAGVSHAGTFDAQSSSFIDFAAGTHQFNSGAAFSAGTGVYKVNGATLNLLTNVSAPNFALLSGSVVGSGNLDTTSNFSWSGGSMAGTGTTTIASGIGSLTSGPLTLNRNFTIGGGTTMNAAGGLAVQTTSTVTNNNTFTVQNGDVLCSACTTASFVNNGTIAKNAASTTNWSVPVTGAGTMSVTAGTFKDQASATFNSATVNNATADFSGSPITIGSISGSSPVVQVTGGATTVSGTTTLSGGTSLLRVTGGTLTLNGAASTDGFQMTGGTLNGGGTLTAATQSNVWSGGTISGSGGTVFNSTLTIDGASGAMVLSRNLTNNATITYTPPNATQALTVNAPAAITNNGQFNVTGGFDLMATGAPVFTNAGVLSRTSGSANAINFGPAVVNSGGISNWSIGSTSFTNGYSQTAGTTTLTAATIGSPAALNFTGGSFTAKGTVNGSVTINGATFNPGNTPGAVTITGDYTQSSTGTLNAELNGTVAGTSYDQVIVNGNVNLNGTFNATLGYTPANGDVFDVITFAGTRTGDFATYNLPTFPGGGSIQKAYVSGSPNVLRLTAIVTASDLMITQVAPTSLLHGQNGTWTLTITNGPTPVTNVVVTDTFANASFVSATSVGPCTPSGSTVTCNLGSLAANQSVNVSLILNANVLATISNSASVTATEFDPNTSNNNTGNAFTTVLPSADLSITNTASGNPVNAGSALSFSITVNNAGPDATSGTVTVSNTFPSGVTSFTFSGSGWACGALSGGVATCSTASSIAASGSAPTLVLSMTAPTTSPAVDSATVSASTGDPNSGNNSASQTVAITAQADLAVTKSGPSTAIAGQNIVYTITVANNGPSAATGVSVTDAAPAGLTFVSNSGGCTGAFPCALGTLTSGQVITITSTYSTSPGGGGVTVNNIAAVSSPTSDPNSGNNSGSAVTTINSSADLSIIKSGPAFSTAGSLIVYTITVTNNGPSDAAAVSVTDPDPAGANFISNSGACTTPFPCSLGTMTAGQSKTITSTFSTPPSFSGTTLSNTATVSSTTSDPTAGNNSATAVTSFSAATADLSITKSGPASATNGSVITYTLTVANNGPATATNVVVSDPTPAGLSFFNTGGACSGAFPCSLGNLTPNQSVTITASYTVTANSGSVTNSASVAGTTSDPNPGNDFASATTTIGPITCNTQPPTLTSPANGSTVSSPVTFSWTAVAGATSYKVFASVGGASTQEIGSTSNTSITLPISGGTVVWSVQAIGVANCNQLVSANGTFNVCSANTAPLLSVVGTSSAGQSYTVQWTDIAGVSAYELQEAATDAFVNPQTFQVSGTSRAFTKNPAIATAFFYRVRALSVCGQGPGPFSAAERVVVVPVPPIDAQSPSATVDINNKHVVVQTVFIPGQGSAIPFIASTDEPWLTVTPSSGILPAAGITLTVSADPADLPNGTFTATIILTFPGAPGKVGALDAKPAVTVPVSISVVTPVSPTTLSTPPANSLIIPSVGHLDGINSQWRSDVRITNTAAQKINYLLRFTPAGGDPNAIKQTQVSIAANDTMALDDIVKNWYGVGALGDAANGVLEIRPLNTSGKGSPNAEDVNVSLVTVASSRTFNQSAGGTLGQYIPAIPFANFVGKVSGDARAGILSMQQIAQSPSYRTNLGIVEAAGKPTSVLVSVFDAAGKNLLDIPIDLKAGEQQQLNSFLAAKNITLTDGRVEVKVTGGDGKVTAYASVVDNKTTDPLLVNGVPLVQTPARSFVLPGVADLNNGLASWRTDMRIFNAGTDPQYVTLTLYPLAGGATSDTISRSFTVNPGEVSILDNVLASRFGVTNIGGAMHVDTLSDANLVVTGRTYNLIDGGGTYGQYIAAVTPADAVGKGSRTLNVLQVEDSSRYRTNLGIAEVSGKPVTVEVSVFLPDAKVAPKVTIPLAANEYRQFRVLQQLGVGTAYNARIAIKVIDGEGRITAYGSVIDMQTQDPTYVPAQ